MGTSGEMKEDVQGRIESFDQSVRSLERRLRALERRMSVEVPPEDLGTFPEPSHPPTLSAPSNGEVAKMAEELRRIRGDVDELVSLVQGSLRQDIDQLSDRLDAATDDQNARISRIEEQNRISIGSIKIPVELSGILGGAMLLVAGSLIMAERWDIIRSPYFSFSLAGVLAAGVFVKFYLANKKVV
ncbi:MAG: hypothetical protein K8R64_00360 [Methanosarcinaceae archaeon]|nr:hypothetical protein [Methanosarcinaceae archaeon]